MADSEMAEHVTPSKMELFCARALDQTEQNSIARHLSECSDCTQQLVPTLKRQKGTSHVSFTLAPEFWLRHEHVDYEHLVQLTDNKLQATDRELIDAHLQSCAPCQEDVRSLLAFREQIASEMSVSYGPKNERVAAGAPSWVGWWRALGWKPIYSAALVAIAIALVIGVVILVNRKSENQQAQNVPTPQVSPSSHLPSASSSPNESPSEKPNSTEAMVVLNDRSRTITIDKSGNVTGLDDVPASTRNEIAQVLMSGRIDQPPVLRNLRGEESSLRGSSAGQPFKLIAPARAVIVSSRPTFKWDRVSGATAYTVFVNDSNGRIIAKSDVLTPEQTEWRAPTGLKRGEIYAWTVTAVLDGKEISSPGPSAREMKFQILSAANLAQLNQLKRVRSHLALGLLYAKSGLVNEAEHELQTLVRQNPNSQSANELLMKIRSWQ